jgi:iron complex outermembrane receptor protein
MNCSQGIAGVVRRVMRVAAVGGIAGSTLLGVASEAQQGLEEIVVTAQRRETALQTTPIAISAVSGEQLAENKIFSAGELARDVPGFSLTALTPLDVELNIRGITNTRLDSPTADPSVSTFLDGVYVGRTGDLSFDFYDLERVEVIRGPQGVLLGKNVVGGALSVITAKPSFDPSGKILIGYGNYDEVLLSGHVTGGLSDSIAGRFSFQSRNRDGYAEDILHQREVEDLDSIQARGQLLFAPDGAPWSTRLVVDYLKDSTNGLNTVAVEGGITNCEQTYLRTNCTRPWSNLRRYLGLTDPRKNVANSVKFVDKSAQTQQFSRREGGGAMVDIEYDFGGFVFNSLTGYRQGKADQLYDQTGSGPEALGWDVNRWLDFVSFVATTRPTGNGSNGQLLFSQPVAEKSETTQLSQEFRLTSDNADSRWDWIAGAYFKQDDIDKIDRFVGENFLGALIPGGNNPLSTLSGENRWVNEGEITNFAVFGQLGFKFTDKLKLSVGLRYTEDEKEGTVTGTVVETGDRFSPNDPRPNVTIQGLCTRPDGTIVSPNPAACVAPNRWVYGEGDSFTTPYKEKWDKVTPQGILEYTYSEDLFLYATVAEGFKGGGFDDTPANPAQASTPYNPEEVTNYEMGFKASFLDRRMRLNMSFFYMDYKNLQVTQTNAACLCNLTDNAASAEIKGVEAEFQFAVTDALRLFASGSYIETEYKDFLESAIDPTTGQRLDSSGNRLQRTPETQFSGGFDYVSSVGKWEDALRLRVNYSYTGDFFWATDNIAKEDAFGVLDARIGFAPRGASWGVGLWGKNLTDELYRTNIIPFFGEEVSQFAPPRTYGVDFSISF